MTVAIGSMRASELLHDAEAETKPECASGIRRKASVGTTTLHDLTVATLDELARRRVRPADALAVGLRQCRDEFRAWERDPPTEQVRDRVHERYRGLMQQAIALLGGNR